MELYFHQLGSHRWVQANRDKATKMSKAGMAVLVQDEEGMRCGEKAIMSGDSIE